MIKSTISRRGLLYLIGGAEDRHKDSFVLKEMVDLTQPSVIVVIPTASSYPQSINRDYTDVFRRLDVPDIKCLDIRYRDEADRDENLQAVEDADLVFFGGGDQVRLVDILIQTRFIDLIRTRFETGGLHIAGTAVGSNFCKPDYDGVGDSLPTGLKDVSSYPNLIEGLLRRGYSEEDVRKILGENLLRVWSAVEDYAATTSSST